MIGLSDFCIYIVKCIYRFLKYTGLIVPVIIVALIVSVQEGYFNVTLSNLNLVVKLDFLLIYFSIVAFLYILVKNLIRTFIDFKLYVEYVKKYINENDHKL